MARTNSPPGDSEKAGTYAVEDVDAHAGGISPTSSSERLNLGYEPQTDEAKAMDRRVNLKLDFAVVLILAIDFILCGIDKTNIGYVATTSKRLLIF